MCTKAFSPAKNKGKLFLFAKSSGPLLAGLPLKLYRHTNILPVTYICNILIYPETYLYDNHTSERYMYVSGTKLIS